MVILLQLHKHNELCIHKCAAMGHAMQNVFSLFTDLIYPGEPCCTLLKIGSKTCFFFFSSNRLLKIKSKSVCVSSAPLVKACRPEHPNVCPEQLALFNFPLNVLQRSVRSTLVLHKATGFTTSVCELKPYLLREQTLAQQAAQALCSECLKFELSLPLLRKFHSRESFSKNNLK